MTNSIKGLYLAIKNSINLVTEQEYTIDDTCVMAITLCQQKVNNLKLICSYEFETYFESKFTYYKEKDTNVGTTNGNNILIPVGEKYIFVGFSYGISIEKETK